MNARRKGHDGERELARLLRHHLGTDVRRNLEQTRSGGHDLEVAGFALEVKRAATVTEAKVRTWWRQALAQAERARLTPALAYRADRQPWAVRVPLARLGIDAPDGLTADLCVDGFAALVREAA